MKKALRIISIAMPLVIFVLYFIPIFSLGTAGINGPTMTTPSGEIVSSFSSSFYTISRDGFGSTKVCAIIFFIIALTISLGCSFLAQKHYYIACINIFALSYFWIGSSVFVNIYDKLCGMYCRPHASFYISLILSAFFLAVFIAYAVKWLKPRLASIPPHEHKPTKSERIAELEARVRELENRDGSND